MTPTQDNDLPSTEATDRPPTQDNNTPSTAETDMPPAEKETTRLLNRAITCHQHGSPTGPQHRTPTGFQMGEKLQPSFTGQ